MNGRGGRRGCYRADGANDEELCARVARLPTGAQRVRGSDHRGHRASARGGARGVRRDQARSHACTVARGRPRARGAEGGREGTVEAPADQPPAQTSSVGEKYDPAPHITSPSQPPLIISLGHHSSSLSHQCTLAYLEQSTRPRNSHEWGLPAPVCVCFSGHGCLAAWQEGAHGGRDWLAGWWLGGREAGWEAGWRRGKEEGEDRKEGRGRVAPRRQRWLFPHHPQNASCEQGRPPGRKGVSSLPEAVVPSPLPATRGCLLAVAGRQAAARRQPPCAGARCSPATGWSPRRIK